MNNHTPGPWTYDQAYRELVRKTGDGDYQPIGTFHNAPTPEDIEFLLRAVNAHEDMLSALKELKAVLELSEATVVFGAQYKVVCEAIAKAEGK
jgi:hypothetical protein